MGNPRIGPELTWFWTWSEGEMSAPSNFMAMANAISLGPQPASYPNTEMDEGRLNAASRARFITRTLENVSDDDRRILFVAFGPHRRELPVLGEAAPVAALTEAAHVAYRASQTARTFEDWLVRLCWRVARHLGDRALEDSAALHSIATDAKAALAKAIAAYRKAEQKRASLAVSNRVVPFKTDSAVGVEGRDRREAGDTNI